ncbi:MAG: peptidoglycan DD-metalloendopeptidase family protein [Anaerolineaceae bacterium]|nr:peptidoglycan DD-metalloendopeptidase family protein [Anaerolineaceae bacterium]MBN2678006.1 peptidoglycan DD-metalloendopeptidase family protein [Anaerolineaceae bacterium]
MVKKSSPRFLRYLPLGIILAAAIILSAMFFSGGMRKVSAWYLLQFVLPITGLIGLIYAIIRSFVIKRIDNVAQITGVVSLLGIAPVFMLFFPPTFPASLEHTTPSATVRLPADELLKVAWGGDTRDVNQHVVVPDQRWAYDFVIEPYFTGSSNLNDYGCYGVDIVAPASGVVTTAHDGEPDEVPGLSSNNLTAPTGNHVVIQLDETGTYLLVAHMKSGSVTVTAGQHVEEGQVIGKCGNSGNTSEPHIHIHHQRQDPNEYPINFAEGLPLFFRDHDGAAMPVGGYKVVDGTPIATGDSVIHLGEH